MLIRIMRATADAVTPRAAVDLADLPAPIGTGNESVSAGARWNEWSRALLAGSVRHGRHIVIEDFERRYLDALLRACEGRVSNSARRAGITKRGLYDLLHKYGLRKELYTRKAVSSR